MNLLATLLFSCSGIDFYYLEDLNLIVPELKCWPAKDIYNVSISNPYFFYANEEIQGDSLPVLVPSADFDLSYFYTLVTVNDTVVPVLFKATPYFAIEDCLDLFLTIAQRVPDNKDQMGFFLTVQDRCNPQKLYISAQLIYKQQILVTFIPVISQFHYLFAFAHTYSEFEQLIGEKLSENYLFEIQFKFYIGFVAMNASVHLRLVDTEYYSSFNTFESFVYSARDGFFYITQKAFLVAIEQLDYGNAGIMHDARLYVYKDGVEQVFYHKGKVNNFQAVVYLVFDELGTYFNMIVDDPQMAVDRAILVINSTKGIYNWILHISHVKIKYFALEILDEPLLYVYHTAGAHLNVYYLFVEVWGEKYAVRGQKLYNGYSTCVVELDAALSKQLRKYRNPAVFVVDRGFRVRVEEVYVRDARFYWAYYVGLLLCVLYGSALLLRP